MNPFCRPEWFVFFCHVSDWWITVSAHILSVGSVFLCFALKITEVVSVLSSWCSASPRSFSRSLSLSAPYSFFCPVFVSISFSLSLKHGSVCLFFFLPFSVVVKRNFCKILPREPSGGTQTWQNVFFNQIMCYYQIRKMSIFNVLATHSLFLP